MKHFFILFAALLLIPFTAGIGMTPPSAEIGFAPLMEGEFDIVLSNSRNHEVSTDVEITGTLGQYFSATTPDIRARGAATSTVSFALPEDIPPGEHRVYITYTETFFSPEEGTVAARTAVRFIAKIWKPFPGQYAEISIVPRHVPAGEDTDAEITIRSRGDQAVRGDVQIRVHDAQGRLVDSEIIGDTNVLADSTWRRFVQINSGDFTPGKFSVNARYDYGAAVAEADATLIVGVRDIDVLNVTQNFYLDKPVNPFIVYVESLWNEPIESVEASFQLGASTGRTPTVHLAPFSQKPLEGFWTTDAALVPGTYNALVTVLFRDGTPVSRSFPITVHEFSPQLQPQVEEPGGITIGYIDMLFILIVLVLIGYIAMHVFNHEKRDI